MDDPMSESANVLDYLREQFARTNDKIDALRADMAEVKQRLTTLEIQSGNFMASEQSHYGATMQRLDRLESRLDRIERRLDLVEPVE